MRLKIPQGRLKTDEKKVADRIKSYNADNISIKVDIQSFKNEETKIRLWFQFSFFGYIPKSWLVEETK